METREVIDSDTSETEEKKYFYFTYSESYLAKSNIFTIGLEK